MKIFVAGARSIKTLDAFAKQKLFSIYSKGYEVIVGDCYGIDSAVQQFYASVRAQFPSPRVTVYASNGQARNNVGDWPVETVSVESGVSGFEFYQRKDVAMAHEADMGFMIWDGESRGTFQNITTLLSLNKPCVVYIPSVSRATTILSEADLSELLRLCSKHRQAPVVTNQIKPQEQMTMF